MSFNGDLYPSAGASVVMTSTGDMIKYQSGARARLGIGSANQILQVKSSLPSWETVDLADTVLTVAGDILFENATPELARLPKGTQYNNLQMGSALPAWSASTTSVLTGAMDILYSSSANTLARLSAGTDGYVLTTHSTGSAPTWTELSAGGATVTITTDELAGDDTTTSSTYSDTSLSVTCQSTASGKGMIVAQLISKIASASDGMHFRFVDDTADRAGFTSTTVSSGIYANAVGVCVVAQNGQAVKMQFRTESGSDLLTLEGDNDRFTTMVMMEVS